MTEPNAEIEAIRVALREVGEDAVPPNVTTLAAVQWLIGEHQVLASQAEELGAESSVLANERATLAWLHAEAVWQRDTARADLRIRQGALNGVLGRPGSADYYEAVGVVADLVSERRRLTARCEAQGLPLALLRTGVRGLLDQVDAMAQQIKALQTQLDATELPANSKLEQNLGQATEVQR